MPDYEKLFFELLNKTQKVTRVMKEFQDMIGDMYAEAVEEDEDEDENHPTDEE